MKKLIFTMALFTWVIATSIGFLTLVDYETRPGAPGQPPTLWPPSTQLSYTQKKSTLIFFAHPQCPCTKASLSELEKLLPHIKPYIHLNIVFYKPEGFEDEWTRGELYDRVTSIKPDKFLIDQDGVELNNFKPKTSGQTYLYNPQGQLIYSGGLTASRGHEGDNDGVARIKSYLLDKKDILTNFSVFGCDLSAKSTQSFMNILTLFRERE